MANKNEELSLRKRCGPIGMLAFFIYRFGNKTVYGSYPLPLKLLRISVYKILDILIVRGFASAGIPARAQIGTGFRLVHEGNGVIIHPKVIIGNNVSIHHQVTIGEKVGDPNFPVIGNNVMIGAGAKIIGGVTIGDYAKIGANAVVMQDVPNSCTAVGIPARIIPATSNSKKENGTAV